MSTILIVDDNEQNLYLLEALLGGNGHEVVSAVNGSKALEIAVSNPPDLIISDILMPVMDGFSLCREWQMDKRLKSVPFIFYTATYTDPKDEQLALSLGAVRFIVKPEEPARFMEIIQGVLDNFTSSILPSPDSASMQEEVYLKEYNERLISKLEQKMLALEKETAERKVTEKQLRHAQKMEAVGTLASGIAHDFNNILTAIIGFSEIAKSQLSSTDAINDDLDKVISAGHRAASLVEQILTFSRQGEENYEPLNMQLIIQESFKLLRASLPSTIELKTESTGDYGVIMANATQMQQVIMNLCTNAKHAIGGSNGNITVSLSEIQVAETDTLKDCPQIIPGKYLHLEVSDTGCGMNELMQNRIFDPFYTSKVKGEGTGLGLAVVHGIVQQHHGEISVKSELGQGSTFHIYLPVIDDEKLSRFFDEQVEIEKLPRGNEKILLVDDELDIAEMTQRLLSGLGYSVIAFSSSVDALKEFRKNPDYFDLLITDMTMPDMNGIILAEEMLQLKPDLPVILCTGFSYSVDELKIKSARNQEVVRKPVIKNILAKSIRKVLDPV